MTKKRKLFTMILLGVLSVMLMLALSACKAFDGPQGPKGEQGIQGEQGADGINGSVWLVGVEAPSAEQGVDGDFYLNTATFDLYLKAGGAWGLVGNIKGDDAAETFAVLTFDSDSEDGECDPVFVEKGQAAELPIPEKLGYEFNGWYYNGGEYPRKITDETVIEKSMALKAKWTPALVLSLMEEAVLGEPWEAMLYYPLSEDYDYQPVPLYVDSIEFEGEEYTEDEAYDARLLLDNNFYIEPAEIFDYINGYSYTGYYYIRAYFGQVGDYVINFENYFGKTLSLEVTVAPPEFNGEMAVDSIYFVQGNGGYQAGDTVSYVKGSVPAIDMEVDFYAPFASTFSATLNGVALTKYNNDVDQGGNWYTARFSGELPAEADTLNFTFTVTSEWYGSKTESFTVNIIDTPLENTVLYHSWTETVAPDESEDDSFYEVLTYYSVDGVTPVGSTVLTNSAGETIATFEPTISVVDNEVSYDIDLYISVRRKLL